MSNRYEIIVPIAIQVNVPDGVRLSRRDLVQAALDAIRDDRLVSSVWVSPESDRDNQVEVTFPRSRFEADTDPDDDDDLASIEVRHLGTKAR